MSDLRSVEVAGFGVVFRFNVGLLNSDVDSFVEVSAVLFFVTGGVALEVTCKGSVLAVVCPADVVGWAVVATPIRKDSVANFYPHQSTTLFLHKVTLSIITSHEQRGKLSCCKSILYQTLHRFCEQSLSLKSKLTSSFMQGFTVLQLSNSKELCLILIHWHNFVDLKLFITWRAEATRFGTMFRHKFAVIIAVRIYFGNLCTSRTFIMAV